MSTAVLPLKRAVWIRPKYVLFALVGLMLAYVLRHNEHFLIDAKDPIWPHYRTIWWYLLPHGMMGACALLQGPMQFSDRLRWWDAFMWRASWWPRRWGFISSTLRSGPERRAGSVLRR